jgi:hypothetical protein
MKRMFVILGVTAAMAVAAPVASAGTSAESVRSAVSKSMRSSPEKAGRLPAVELVLHSATDGRSGQTLYRLGSSGLWMA